MATQEELVIVVGKAVLDHKFRKELTDDPSAAAKELGIKLTSEQWAALKAELLGEGTI